MTIITLSEGREGAASPIRKSAPLAQDLVEDFRPDGLDSSTAARGQIQHARLVAADDAGRFCTRQGNREANFAREGAGIGDRQDDGQASGGVERGGRNNQDGAMAVLFPPLRRVEGVPDFAPVQMSSSPTGAASTHSRSSRAWACE